MKAFLLGASPRASGSLRGLFFAGLFLVALLVYYFRHVSLPIGAGDLGQFGDYIGGLMNPVIALLALVAVINGIRLQETELAETRRELEQSRVTAQRQAKHLEEEAVLNDLSRAAALLGESLLEGTEKQVVLGGGIGFAGGVPQVSVRYTSVKELCQACLAWMDGVVRGTGPESASYLMKQGQHLAGKAPHLMPPELQDACRDTADLLRVLSITLQRYEVLRPGSSLPAAYRVHFRGYARALHAAGLLDAEANQVFTATSLTR